MSVDHSTAAFTALTDLASARVGGRAVAASDDFFASKANLLKPEPPVFIPGKYTTRGKWMDGWESRRRRTPGHDWCIVKLGLRGIVHGVNVDTRFFTGNYPSHCSIDGIDASRPLRADPHAPEGRPWTTILEKTQLRGDGDNVIAIDDRRPWTHLRLNIYPDGGVARLRVYGEAEVDWARIVRSGRIVDLASILNGGLVLAVSDMHFGPKENMLMPGRAANMGDGWETRRRRGPGYDWAIVRLGTTGRVQRVEIDTNHYKGNYPDSASLEGCFAPGASLAMLEAAEWRKLLAPTKLRAHHRHYFAVAQGRSEPALARLRDIGPVSHVRLNIFPDGGISRLRVYGSVSAPQ